MSTYSLDIDANTFDWNSSLGVKAKPSVFVSLCGSLWALFMRVLECVSNEDSWACTSTVFRISMCRHVIKREVHVFACFCVCVYVCVFYVSACVQEFFLTVWLTAAINRIKSKWARAPSRSLQSLPSQGEEETYRRPPRLHLHKTCMCAVDFERGTQKSEIKT